jgi:hypothetical protein
MVGHHHTTTLASRSQPAGVCCASTLDRPFDTGFLAHKREALQFQLRHLLVSVVEVGHHSGREQHLLADGLLKRGLVLVESLAVTVEDWITDRIPTAAKDSGD